MYCLRTAANMDVGRFFMYLVTSKLTFNNRPTTNTVEGILQGQQRHSMASATIFTIGLYNEWVPRRIILLIKDSARAPISQVVRCSAQHS